MKFIKMIIDFFKNLFGLKKEAETPPPNNGHVFTAPTTGTYEISYRTYPEEEKDTRTFAQKVKDHQDERRSSLSDTNLLLYYAIIKKQVEDGTRDGTVLIEYINELEYRGLKYEEIIWGNTNWCCKIIND